MNNQPIRAKPVGTDRLRHHHIHIHLHPLHHHCKTTPRSDFAHLKQIYSTTSHQRHDPVMSSTPASPHQLQNTALFFFFPSKSHDCRFNRYSNRASVLNCESRQGQPESKNPHLQTPPKSQQFGGSAALTAALDLCAGKVGPSRRRRLCSGVMLSLGTYFPTQI